MPDIPDGSIRGRGPYGTNPNDTWIAPDSLIQKRLDFEGTGLTLIHWINEEGEETVYVTKNEELIEEARRGYEAWVAARADEN